MCTGWSCSLFELNQYYHLQMNFANSDISCCTLSSFAFIQLLYDTLTLTRISKYIILNVLNWFSMAYNNFYHNSIRGVHQLSSLFIEIAVSNFNTATDTGTHTSTHSHTHTHTHIHKHTHIHRHIHWHLYDSCECRLSRFLTAHVCISVHRAVAGLCNSKSGFVIFDFVSIISMHKAYCFELHPMLSLLVFGSRNFQFSVIRDHRLLSFIQLYDTALCMYESLDSRWHILIFIIIQYCSLSKLLFLNVQFFSIVFQNYNTPTHTGTHTSTHSHTHAHTHTHTYAHTHAQTRFLWMPPFPNHFILDGIF